MKTKKIALCLTALLVWAALLAGCGKLAAANGGKEDPSASGAAANALYAEVGDIVGNQLTLKVLRGSFNAQEIADRMNNRPSGANGEPVSGGNWRGEGGSLPDGAQFSLPEGMSRGNWEAVTDENGAPVSRPNFTPREPQTDENGEPVTVDVNNMRYTGEEKEVIIPIGTPIKSISFTDGELKTKDADIGDIKNGNTVNVVYQADGTTIQEVQIINMSGWVGGGMFMGGGVPGEGGMPDPGQIPDGAQVFPVPDGGAMVVAGGPAE
ncbi:MAG: hypothetical protein LBJ11_04725 [Oscillospiraceae bacterium]|jgi:hypothetical protein|nr:hypothetical protein [Oscillospiraceae bacterium]